MAPLPLITAYRPIDFDDVLLVGQEAAVKALRLVLDTEAHPHAFLFSGPSGTGKTTLARIVASKLGAELVEVDAASNSGIDAMRALTEMGQYKSLSGTGRRFILIDEAHGLSRAAGESLLKALEDPPAHLYYALCTTALDKITETIKTRTYHVLVKAVRIPDLEKLLGIIANTEGMKVNGEIIGMVAQAANGSPRQAISMLQAVQTCVNVEEAKRLIALPAMAEPLLNLCRLLASGRTTFNALLPAMKLIPEEDWEDALPLVGRFLCSCIDRAKTETEARHFFSLLGALTFPTETFDRKVRLYAVIGRIMYGE